MQPALFNSNGIEGVFGPMILLNGKTGTACARLADGSLLGEPPLGANTNAFCVWSSGFTIVVSTGVQADAFDRVATALRELTERPTVPIAFILEQEPRGVERATVNAVEVYSRRDIAKAIAYVQVQCSWNEGPEVGVVIADESFTFHLRFVAGDGGRLRPVLV